MDALEKQALKERIEEEIEKTTDAVAKYEEVAKPIAPENSIGRISRMDAINNKSVTEAALRTAKRKLKKLQLALSKIDEDPNFGHCKRCKKVINTQRLMLMPESQYCVKCAR